MWPSLTSLVHVLGSSWYKRIPMQLLYQTRKNLGLFPIQQNCPQRYWHKSSLNRIFVELITGEMIKTKWCSLVHHKSNMTRTKIETDPRCWQVMQCSVTSSNEELMLRNIWTAGRYIGSVVHVTCYSLLFWTGCYQADNTSVLSTKVSPQGTKLTLLTVW
jgi:hypothetical protein